MMEETDKLQQRTIWCLLFLTLTVHGRTGSDQDSRESNYPNVGKKFFRIAIGIHFSRDHVTCGVFQEGYFQRIPNTVGQHSTPIAVAFPRDPGLTVLVGDQALLAPPDSDRITNLAQILGRSYDELRSLPDFPFPYELTNRYNKPYIRLQSQELELTTEEVLSHLFRQLRTDSDAFLDDSVSTAVLSISDHYDESQLMAIKAALSKAGWSHVVRTLRDSETIAFSHHVFGFEDEHSLLVVDVHNSETVLTAHIMENVNFERLAQFFLPGLGQHDLGGRLLEQYLRGQGLGIGEEVALARACAVANDRLQGGEEAVPVLMGGEIVAEVTRARLEELQRPLLLQLLGNVTLLLAEAELGVADVSDVLVHGDMGSSGSSGRLERALRQRFSPEEGRVRGGSCRGGPEYGVALLGWVEAGQVAQQQEGSSSGGGGSSGEHRELRAAWPELLPRDIGIEIARMQWGMMDVLLPRGSVLPASTPWRRYRPRHPRQSSVVLRLLEGDRPASASNAELGQLDLLLHASSDDDIEEQKSQSLLEVRLEADRDGTVTLLTRTNQHQHGLLVIRSWAGMPGEEDDQQQQQNDPRRFSDKDDRLKIMFQMRRRLEAVVAELETAMREPGLPWSQEERSVVRMCLDETFNWLERHVIPNRQKRRSSKDENTDNEDNEIEDILHLEKRLNSTVHPVLRKHYFRPTV